MKQKLRIIIQASSAALLNGYAAGFLNRKIFTGRIKGLCVPVLNCYSCPGSLGACPIGALQTVIGTGRKFPFYVLGTLMLFGVLTGRLACGILCPFGFIQDLIGRIPLPKLRVPKAADKVLRAVKYVILAVAVILLPALLRGDGGVSVPYFCKYICPAGTLEGGIFHVLANPDVRRLAGALFGSKLALLAVFLILAVFIPRSFCRYVCPLGAFYSIFNRFAFFRLYLDKSKCVDCGKCERVCPMAVDVRRNINSAECIRCGKCREICPTDAIEAERLFAKAKEPE